MMGQLFASQVHHALSKDVYNANPNTVVYIGEKKVGEFMKKKVFEPGRTKDWKGLTKFATGEELNPKALAKDFEGKPQDPSARGERSRLPPRSFSHFVHQFS